MAPAPTTASVGMSASYRSGVPSGVGHGLGVEQPGQLGLVEAASLARNLANRAPGAVRLLGDRGGGVIADARRERGAEHEPPLHQGWTVLGGGNPVDALGGQVAR